MSQLGYNPYLLNIIPLFNVADPTNSSTDTALSDTLANLQTIVNTTTNTIQTNALVPFTDGTSIQVNGDLTVNGNLEVTGDVTMGNNLTVAQDITCQTLFQLSDMRLKSNVKPVSNALSTICQLQGVHYTIDGKPSIGFVAQEVASILPEVVGKSDEGYLTIDYSKIIPILVEAIKELALLKK